MKVQRSTQVNPTRVYIIQLICITFKMNVERPEACDKISDQTNVFCVVLHITILVKSITLLWRIDPVANLRLLKTAAVVM
jgi:hypothetical protein